MFGGPGYYAELNRISAGLDFVSIDPEGDFPASNRATRFRTTNRAQASSPNIRLLVRHLPRVKSGKSTRALPDAIDCSDKGAITIHATVS